jgi:hypothetical protein
MAVHSGVVNIIADEVLDELANQKNKIKKKNKDLII